MYIDDKELVDLVLKEKAIVDELKEVVEEIQSHSNKIAEIREQHQDKLKESEELRGQIALRFIPVVLASKEEHETFGNPEVIDGKVFIPLEDQSERAMELLKENIKKGDDIWRDYIERAEIERKALEVIEKQG